MWSGPLSREQTADNIREWLSEYERGYGFLAVIYKPEGTLIGQCGLGAEDGRVGLGYMLDKAYWGRGLATEAAKAGLMYGFAELDLEWLWAGTQAGNTASRRVLEKLGMSLREMRRTSQGEEALYALSRNEFLAPQAQKKEKT